MWSRVLWYSHSDSKYLSISQAMYLWMIGCGHQISETLLYTWAGAQLREEHGCTFSEKTIKWAISWSPLSSASFMPYTLNASVWLVPQRAIAIAWCFQDLAIHSRIPCGPKYVRRWCKKITGRREVACCPYPFEDQVISLRVFERS